MRSLKIFVVLTLSLLVSESTFGENWPQFRGPTGQGHAGAASVPIVWDSKTNVAWNTEIPGAGWSSPIYWEGQIFLTSAIPVEGGEANDQHLSALCLDGKTGEIKWRRDIFRLVHDGAESIHGKNTHASPTPIADGNLLYVHFGANGTACLSLDGDIKWAVTPFSFKQQHGNGGSPALINDLLVVNCDGADIQFVAALSVADGDVRWKKERPPIETKKGFSFCTPLVIEVDGQNQIVSPGSDQVIAYQIADGKELWRYGYRGYSVVPRPVYSDGLLYFSTSFDQAKLYCIRPQLGQTTPEVVWSIEKGAPHTPSPLLVENRLYFVSDRGVATCADAKTGEAIWVQRLGGNYSASPTFAGNHIYFQNEDGGTVVIRPGASYEEVARNALPGRTLASMAVADNAIFLRTDSRLYRIQEH